MALPQTEKYSSLKSAIQPMVSSAYKIGRALPKPAASKVQDPSKYSGLAGTVKNAPKNIQGLGPVTTQYGGSTRYEKFHPGVDVANKTGTRIPSSVAGKVSKVVSGKRQGDKGFGNYVEIVDGKGNRHRYSHLNQSFVTVGQAIGAGQPLGAMGKTGSVYSQTGGDPSHLDYRVWNMYNKNVNPMTFLNV